MESKRQQQVARLLQRELSAIFQKDARHLFGKAFITITTVRVTPDLGIARVYLSFMLVDNKQETLEDIKDHTKSIRQMLGQKIRNSVRIIPELNFYLDDTADYAAKMDALLGGLDIPPAEEDQSEEE